jgi:hypothetical protein
MEKTHPKKLEMLLLDGAPTGLRYLDLRNWIGRAFVSPRISLSKLLNRPELEKPGIYILFGDSESADLPEIYVGEADNLRARLPQHNEKDFWNEVIVFISQDETLDKAGVRYIESRLVQDLMSDKLCKLKNGNVPLNKSVSEADRAVLEEFIEKIKLILLVLGYKIFRFEDHMQDKHEDLFLSVSGIEAKGKETEEGFLIYSGSQVTANPSGSMSESYKQLREELIKNGVLTLKGQAYEFTQDYLLTSPSYASSMVLGYSSNGRSLWKNKKGKPLKEIQADSLKS